MKNPPSSSHAEWYRNPWPWLLFAGPLAVVVASLATAWIAYKSDDGVVAQDYYKRGLLVNRLLPQDALPPPHLAATIAFAEGGVVVHPEAGDASGDLLHVTLAHPASGTRESITLVRDTRGDYVGTLRSDRLGRWIVTFDSPAWPLPTTLVERNARPGVAGRAESSPAIR